MPVDSTRGSFVFGLLRPVYCQVKVYAITSNHIPVDLQTQFSGKLCKERGRRLVLWLVSPETKTTLSFLWQRRGFSHLVIPCGLLSLKNASIFAQYKTWYFYGI